MPTNTAVYLLAVGQPLEVKEALYPEPGENEIIVHNKAVVINLIDIAYQKMGPSVFPWLKIPGVIGSDVAGEVVAIGPSVSHFAVGDRVVGHVSGAFQAYSTMSDHMAAIIPATIPYEQAAVIPLGYTTAVLGFFHQNYLALERPGVEVKPSGKTILIWGGSTSVGSNAIQAAVLAGNEVITTASPKNFDYVKALGAAEVFGYNSPTIKDELLTAFKGKICAGAVAIASIDAQSRNAAATACIEVVAGSEGTKFVALNMPPPPSGLPKGVKANFVNATVLRSEREFGYKVYDQYLSAALAAGNFKPAPEVQGVGKGLEALQPAMDQLGRGVRLRSLLSRYESRRIGDVFCL